MMESNVFERTNNGEPRSKLDCIISLLELCCAGVFGLIG